jgi:hypothetical protein
LVDTRYNPVNKNCLIEKQFQEREVRPYYDRRLFRVHYLNGHYFIVLDDAVHPQENEWYAQERQPNGDVLLRKATILAEKRIASSSLKTNPADYSDDSSPQYQHEHDVEGGCS